MKKNIYLIFSLLLFFSPLFVFGHQPNFVQNKSVVFDSEPTLSKAYYGTLNNQPTVYNIYSTSTFDMYVNLLSPDIPETLKDFTITIRDDKKNIIKTVSSNSSEWIRWYEEFGGDWYFKGPEFKEQFQPGMYTISVQNQTNTGRYVLAIGEIESFPINQFTNTITQLYRIKTLFFNEPWYGIYYGIIGKYLFLSSIILVFILVVIISITIRIIRKRYINTN